MKWAKACIATGNNAITKGEGVNVPIFSTIGRFLRLKLP